jgi:uncharacterized membrane protein YecN with MAPEG domain
MNATAPTIALYAGLLGLLAAALTLNVILNRVRTGVESGVRAHANFVEQAPIALIVIACAEAAGARTIVVLAWVSRCWCRARRPLTRSTNPSCNRPYANLPAD